ncbi:MAG: hypothetical protein ABSD32_11765, partial [Mycobacterium sp.]
MANALTRRLRRGKRQNAQAGVEVAGAAETADKSESKASESKAPEAAPETRPEGRKAPVAAKPQVKMEDSGARTR